MTKLMRQAIAEVEKLPSHEQDAVARQLLADLADEKVWASRFAATTDEQWDRMAAKVRGELTGGDVTPLDEVIPPGSHRP